ncbi:MAG: hypothetical protein P1P64_02150 [Treponemataceae bacterium]
MGGIGGKIEAELDGSKFETSDRVKTFYVELPKEKVTIKAIPNAGYKVKEWLNAPVTHFSGEEVTFDVTEDINIFVRFEKKPSVVGMNAILTLGDKKEISVRVKTADGSPVEVKGCDETSLDSNEKDKTTLHAKDETVILAGDIIELDCEKCGLTELDVKA